MNNLTALTVAAALALVAAPGMATSLVASEADSVGFVNDGERVYLRHEYQGAEHVGNGLLVREQCSSDGAVAGYYCTTGQHTTGFYYILIGFNIAQPGLTGILEHVVSSDAGEVRFRCTWNAGAWAGCQIISVTWPGAGNEFHHDLWAYGKVFPRNVGGIPYNPAITAPAGTPGAEGDWAGYIDHA